jgi:hypothetical protein
MQRSFTKKVQLFVKVELLETLLRNIRLRPIFTIIFLLLLLAACNQDGGDGTPAADEPEEVNQNNVQFVPFVDDALGLSAQYPANWVFQSSFSGATFASSQSAIDAQSLADIGEEGFVVVIPGEISYFNFQTSQTFDRDDILQALATYKVLLEREGQSYVTVEPPEALTKNNQNLARMVLRSTEDGEPLITIMAVVMSDTHIALISAASLEDTADEMRPIFESIIESVEVRAPGSISTESESD